MGKRVSKLRKKQKVYSKILSKVGGVEWNDRSTVRKYTSIEWFVMR